LHPKAPNIRIGGWSEQAKASSGASKSSLGFSDVPRSNGNGVHLNERNMRSKIFAPKTQKVSYDARFTDRYKILAICSQPVELSLLNSFKKLEKSTFSQTLSLQLHMKKSHLQEDKMLAPT
jgi:hypothetical protein